MKRFIFSVLAACLIFIGVGAIVDKAGAKFKSDEKALELIRQARAAIGGDSAIIGIQSMVIKGTTTRNFKHEGVERAMSGETEIALQLPDKFMKMVKIGHEGTDGKTGQTVERRVNVVVIGDDKNEKGTKTMTVHAGEGEGYGAGSGAGVKKIVIKNADGTTRELTGPEAEKWIAEKHMNGDGSTRIVVRDPDGTTRTVDGENGERKIELRKAEGGNVEFRTESDRGVTPDGQNVMIRRVGGEGHHGDMHQNEMLRATLGLLLTAPAGMDVDYTYGGEGDVDGTACNIVVATTGGSSFKLYLGKSSNLPVMLSYTGMRMPQMVHFERSAPATADGERETVLFKTMAESEAKAEFQVKFSDYRLAGGVQLPYKWTQTVGGQPDETFDVTDYEINPANIADRFQNQKVMVRMKKPDNK